MLFLESINLVAQYENMSFQIIILSILASVILVMALLKEEGNV